MIVRIFIGDAVNNWYCWRASPVDHSEAKDEKNYGANRK